MHRPAYRMRAQNHECAVAWDANRLFEGVAFGVAIRVESEVQSVFSQHHIDPMLVTELSQKDPAGHHARHRGYEMREDQRLRARFTGNAQRILR